MLPSSLTKKKFILIPTFKLTFSIHRLNLVPCPRTFGHIAKINCECIYVNSQTQHNSDIKKKNLSILYTVHYLNDLELE